MKSMWLIQRGMIQINSGSDPKRISESVSFDYMGSAEFEYGALSESLREVKVSFDVYKLETLSELKEIISQRSLRIFYPDCKDFNLSEYIEWLKRLSRNEVRLQEWSNFDAWFKVIVDPTNSIFSRMVTSQRRTDFWWDIQNHVFWSFNKRFMNKFPKILQATFNYMDSSKKKG